MTALPKKNKCRLGKKKFKEIGLSDVRQGKSRKKTVLEGIRATEARTLTPLTETFYVCNIRNY